MVALFRTYYIQRISIQFYIIVWLQFGSSLKSFQREITSIFDDIQRDHHGGAGRHRSPRGGRVYVSGWVPRIDHSDIRHQSTIHDTGLGLGRSVTYRPVTSGSSDGSGYVAVRSHCLRVGTLWEDPDFPPVARSLFYKKAPSAWPDVQWKRPHVSILFFPEIILYRYV